MNLESKSDPSFQDSFNKEYNNYKQKWQKRRQRIQNEHLLAKNSQNQNIRTYVATNDKISSKVWPSIFRNILLCQTRDQFDIIYDQLEKNYVQRRSYFKSIKQSTGKYQDNINIDVEVKSGLQIQPKMQNHKNKAQIGLHLNLRNSVLNRLENFELFAQAQGYNTTFKNQYGVRLDLPIFNQIRQGMLSPVTQNNQKRKSRFQLSNISYIGKQIPTKKYPFHFLQENKSQTHKLIFDFEDKDDIFSSDIYYKLQLKNKFIGHYYSNSLNDAQTQELLQGKHFENDNRNLVSLKFTRSPFYKPEVASNEIPSQNKQSFSFNFYNPQSFFLKYKLSSYYNDNQTLHQPFQNIFKIRAVVSPFTPLNVADQNVFTDVLGYREIGVVNNKQKISLGISNNFKFYLFSNKVRNAPFMHFSTYFTPLALRKNQKEIVTPLPGQNHHLQKAKQIINDSVRASCGIGYDLTTSKSLLSFTYNFWNFQNPFGVQQKRLEKINEFQFNIESFH